MNLTDLQLELRSIDEHIANLHSEIKKMKPQPEEEKKTDFEQVTKLAEKDPVTRYSISEAATETKKIMISSLAYMLLLDESDFYNRLLYLCRLAKGCGYDATAEDIYKSGLEFEMTDINTLCNTIAEYKDSYLVEALIIANYSKESSVEILSMIADMAQCLDVSKEQLRVLGMTAKGVLMNDMDILLDIPVPSKNMWNGRLKDYLTDQWLEKQRHICGILYNKQNVFKAKDSYDNSKSRMENMFLGHMNLEELSCTIKSKLNSGSIVQKGDVICSYIEQEKIVSSEIEELVEEGLVSSDELEYFSEEKSIVAPCDGIVYFIDGRQSGIIKDKYIAIYVVSYFDDYSKFVAWYQKNLQHQ